MITTLASVKPGQAFTYGGMPWIKLEDASRGTLALAAESVFARAFCENSNREFAQYNNWGYSTLRHELNDDFYETLLENGADAGAFLYMTVDLTADDGLDDYGTSSDKIALISCEQYRKYRRLIPALDDWWWTVTALSPALRIRTASAASSRRARCPTTSRTTGTGAFARFAILNLKSWYRWTAANRRRKQRLKPALPHLKDLLRSLSPRDRTGARPRRRTLKIA